MKKTLRASIQDELKEYITFIEKANKEDRTEDLYRLIVEFDGLVFLYKKTLESE